MMDIQFIEDNFIMTKLARAEDTWLLQPKPNGSARDYRYLLTFIPLERRFTLSRQRVTHFQSVLDDDLLGTVKKLLSPEAIAECMRKAITATPEPDDLPF